MYICIWYVVYSIEYKLLCGLLAWSCICMFGLHFIVTQWVSCTLQIMHANVQMPCMPSGWWMFCVVHSIQVDVRWHLFEPCTNHWNKKLHSYNCRKCIIVTIPSEVASIIKIHAFLITRRAGEQYPQINSVYISIAWSIDVDPRILCITWSSCPQSLQHLPSAQK